MEIQHVGKARGRGADAAAQGKKKNQSKDLQIPYVVFILLVIKSMKTG